jgi:hypothetical protein
MLRSTDSNAVDHNPNCEHCNIRDTHWVEVKKRLEELQ